MAEVGMAAEAAEETKRLVVVEEEIRTLETRQIILVEVVEGTNSPVPVEENLLLEMGKIDLMYKVVEVVETAGPEEEEEETTPEEEITIIIKITTKVGEAEEGEDEVLAIMIQRETMAAEVEADEDKQIVHKFPLHPLFS